MLRAGRALMFSKGYRPKGKYKHVAVVEFVKSRFGREFSDLMLFILTKQERKGTWQFMSRLILLVRKKQKMQ